MISAQTVYNVLVTLVSPGCSKGADILLPFCSTSLEKIRSLLCEDADPADNRIAYAAACDAFYMYMLSLLSDVEGNADFKAGDLSVSRNIKETLAVAEKMKADGLLFVRELLRDFSFGVWSV